MYQEDPRPFQANIPTEVRDRAATGDTATDSRRALLRQVGTILTGAGLIIAVVLLGAVAGLLITGAVIVVLARSTEQSDA